MEKICGVVLYKPSISDIDNLLFYVSYFDKVFVYLNSEIEQKPTNIKIRYIGNGINDGLSIAFDTICREAILEGFSHLILLDQDSRISIESLDLLFLRASNGNISEDKIAIYCPTINYNQLDMCHEDKHFVSWCISSGTLFDLSIYDSVVKYDLNYFIDRLDRDFCRQIINKGFKILQVSGSVLNQQLGISLNTKRRTYSSHSDIRHYYIARNRLYYRRKYHDSLLISLLQSIRQLVEIILYEDYKVSKLRFMIKGIYDHLKMKYGKINF